jgi:hypothetical protein
MENVKCNELGCVSVNNLHTCTLMHAYLHTITLPCTTLVLVLGMVNVFLVQKFSLLENFAKFFIYWKSFEENLPWLGYISWVAKNIEGSLNFSTFVSF